MVRLQLQSYAAGRLQGPQGSETNSQRKPCKLSQCRVLNHISERTFLLKIESSRLMTATVGGSEKKCLEQSRGIVLSWDFPSIHSQEGESEYTVEARLTRSLGGVDVS